jgi:hypothetical protein
MRQPGVEPGAKAWEASMLPIHHWRIYMRSSTTKKYSPWGDSNPQPPDPKSDALSIAPQGHLHCTLCTLTNLRTTNMSLRSSQKNMSLQRGSNPRSTAYEAVALPLGHTGAHSPSVLPPRTKQYPWRDSNPQPPD